MKEFSLYRRRIIPNECILLKDDEIVFFENDKLVTRWNTIRPKKDIHHGISCFFLADGFKVSKFYGHSGQLLYWYIDIISHDWDKETNSLYVTDLLADVIIYPDGFVKVVDVEELADALEKGDISTQTLCESLRKLNQILTDIYSDEFKKMKDFVESFE
jgi:predicted RNA-binding protein associated with RNAse of E/G family